MADGVWTLGEMEVCGMWVLSPGETRVARKSAERGCFPGREYLSAEDSYSPDEH